MRFGLVMDPHHRAMNPHLADGESASGTPMDAHLDG